MRGINEQLHELKSLRGKNQNVIEHMMKRVTMEKQEFDASLMKMQGTFGIYAFYRPRSTPRWVWIS